MRTIGEISAALEARKVSGVELVQEALARIASAQAGLNAFITVDAEAALAAARETDAARSRGEATALSGIPIVSSRCE